MLDVYEVCPVFENESFLLRLVKTSDTEDLWKVYSDLKAVPFFNGDNCNGDTFYYPTLERMRQAVDFWTYSYENRYFVRWAIVDKRTGRAVGTIELFHRDSTDEYDNCGILRLDLGSKYENEAAIRSILSLILEPAFTMFSCIRIATKAVPEAAERRTALKGIGFLSGGSPLKGHDGTAYFDYFVFEK